MAKTTGVTGQSWDKPSSWHRRGVSSTENWSKSRQVPGTLARELHVAGLQEHGCRGASPWKYAAAPPCTVIKEHEPYTITGRTRITQGIITHSNHSVIRPDSETWGILPGNGLCSGVGRRGCVALPTATTASVWHCAFELGLKALGSRTREYADCRFHSADRATIFSLKIPSWPTSLFSSESAKTI